MMCEVRTPTVSTPKLKPFEARWPYRIIEKRYFSALISAHQNQSNRKIPGLLEKDEGFK